MEGGRQSEVAKAILTAKNIPYLVAAPLLIQDLATWSRDGIAGLQSVVLYSLPELDGAIDTVPLGGLVGDNIFLIPERCAGGWPGLGLRAARCFPVAEKNEAAAARLPRAGPAGQSSPWLGRSWGGVYDWRAGVCRRAACRALMAPPPLLDHSQGAEDGLAAAQVGGAPAQACCQAQGGGAAVRLPARRGRHWWAPRCGPATCAAA
jgi:hypothetical protein